MSAHTQVRNHLRVTSVTLPSPALLTSTATCEPCTRVSDLTCARRVAWPSAPRPCCASTTANTAATGPASASSTTPRSPSPTTANTAAKGPTGASSATPRSPSPPTSSSTCCDTSGSGPTTVSSVACSWSPWRVSVNITAVIRRRQSLLRLWPALSVTGLSETPCCCNLTSSKITVCGESSAVRCVRPLSRTPVT